MAMTDYLMLVMAWGAGCALGAAYFLGLWWTVRAGVSSAQPARWFLASLVARMSMAMAGFYLVAGGNWNRLLLCLLGFVMARFAVTWLTRPLEERHIVRGREASHAP